MYRSKRLRVFICLVVLAVVSLASCTDHKDAGNPAVSESSVPTSSFVIALLPAQNVFEQKKRYKPLVDYLTRSLGINVRTKLLDSYDAIYNEMLQKRVDAAFFGSLGYIVMNSKIDIEPIARPFKKDGTSTYRGLIFALKDKGITNDVRTWKNKRIALVHKSTTAGYIFPKYYLYKNGVLRFEDYFSKAIYTGSHDASIFSVLNEDADIGCASDQIFDRLTGENPLIRERLVILATSAPVPANILGVRSTDKLLKERLRVTLMNMERTPEGRDILSTLGAVRFIETKKSEFEPVFEMLTTLGLKPEMFAIEAVGKEMDPDSFGTRTRP
ncbi:MAG: phosphate/phosphite/phosphonate ABC transporter substrate-binding protein [Nitrospirota bacterium]